MIKITQVHMNRMGIPEVHWNARMDKIPDVCKHKKPIARYLHNIEQNIEKPMGLLLFGPYSGGKSALGSIILKAATVNCFIGYWTAAFDVPKWLIEKVRFDEHMTIYERCLTVPILVIDEYQMRKEMKFTEDAVDTLVRARVDERLCTVITTNHTPDRIKEARPAMFAALKESVYPLKVQGHDFRDVISKGMKL